MTTSANAAIFSQLLREIDFLVFSGCLLGSVNAGAGAGSGAGADAGVAGALASEGGVVDEAMPLKAVARHQVNAAHRARIIREVFTLAVNEFHAQVQIFDRGVNQVCKDLAKRSVVDGLGSLASV